MQRLGIVVGLLMSLTGCMAPGQSLTPHGYQPPPPRTDMTAVVAMYGWTPPQTYTDLREVVRERQLARVMTELLAAFQMTVMVDGCVLTVWITPMPGGGSSIHSSVNDPMCTRINHAFLSRCHAALNERPRG
jgi:hypothetical protein